MGVRVLRAGELMSFWVRLLSGVVDCSLEIFLVSEVERLLVGRFGT